MNDRQCIIAGSITVAWIWLLFYIGGHFFHDDWMVRWYSIPFIVTGLVGLIFSIAAGGFLGEERDK